MRSDTRGTLAIMGSSLGYGALAVLAKLALERGVGVVPLLAWRFLLGSTFVWGFVLLRRGGVPARRRAGGLLLLGTLYAGNSLAFMMGLDRVPAALASLVFFTYPAVTVIFARIWIGEALTVRRLVALAVALGGCALTAGAGLPAGDGAGIAWILLAVVLLAGFMVASHGILARVPPVGGTAVLLTATGLVLTTAALVSGGLGVPGDPATLGLLGAIGIVSTAVPVTLFLLGIQWIGPGRAAILSTMEPVYTVALAALVLGERLTALQLAGGSLILGAVIWLRLERVDAGSPRPKGSPAPGRGVP